MLEMPLVFSLGKKGISMLQGCEIEQKEDETTNYGLNHENLFLKS